jgi:hypothetical protein
VNQYQNFQPVFEQIKARYDQNPAAGLACKQGIYTNCAVLKLQRPGWTNDPMDRVQNESGIFFSVWIGDEAARLSRAKYNIHALKLRELKGYRITSRDFAAAFREGFSPLRDSWPNVAVDFGPLTLMEGWIDVEPADCENQIFELLQRFELIAPLIDRLLASRRK